MIAGKVVGLGFEIISKLDSYLLMTVPTKNYKQCVMTEYPFFFHSNKLTILLTILTFLITGGPSVRRSPRRIEKSIGEHLYGIVAPGLGAVTSLVKSMFQVQRLRPRRQISK